MINQKFAFVGKAVRIPPVLEVLEWSDRKQFDVVLVNTVGPMGLCGWLASRMLRVPMVVVCHDDLPRRVREFTRRRFPGFGSGGWIYRLAATQRGQGADNRAGSGEIFGDSAAQTAGDRSAGLRLGRMFPGSARNRQRG